jgi:hypothetical protein
VTVGVTQVAADLRAAIDRFGEELRALGRPVGVYGGDVGNTDIQERADPVQIVRGLERDRGFVIRGPPPALMMIQLLASATIVGSPSISASPPSTSV